MKDLTIVAIDFMKHEFTKLAIDQTLTCIEPKEIVVISDKNFYPGSTWVPCKPVINYLMYNELMLKWVYPLIDTEHALYIQSDGLAINKNMWKDSYLQYDYIGAPWPHLPEGANVGNGGFSLRSRKLLYALRDPAIQITDGEKWVGNEDHIFGVNHRRLLEHKYAIKFAPTSVAREFSYESGRYYGPTFGLHGMHNIVATVNYYGYIIENISYANWHYTRWVDFLTALCANNRLDYIPFILDNLYKNSPDYIPELLKYFETLVTHLPASRIVLDRLKRQ